MVSVSIILSPTRTIILAVYNCGLFISHSCGLLVVITLNGFRRVKKSFYKARVAVQYDVVDKEISASFDIEELDLEDRAPMAREQSAILTTKVETAKYASFEEKEAKEVDKCPTCGWILSSSASKCPRCGWQRV